MPTVRIAPSLLSADFGRLAEEVRRVEDAGADWLHVDVMDGHFVPNLTIGLPVVEALKKVARRPLDVHIMIDNPLDFARRYVEAGASTLTFHAEATHEPRAVIDAIRAAGGQPAMAINPDSPVDRVLPFIDSLTMVLVMSVFPGFGGQKFMPDVLPKLTALRRAGFRGDLEIDGGIGPTTIAAAAAAGANVFVAGSAIFGAPDLGGRISELRQQAIHAAAAANASAAR
ncbi:MAG: ribulose-phosphate 3-epimerase [Planctomycetes bacterium]|nr:ribulose-phosphate 3-epimerase [Planctomycetota bacterium]